MLPLIQRTVVDDKKWLTKEEYLDAMTIAQGLPGMIAINIATYIGHKKKGMMGAILATIGVILPSFIIMIIVAMLMKQFADNRFVAGALMGVKACAVGLVIYAVVEVGREILTSVYAWILAVTSFLVLILTGVQVVWVVLAGLAVAICYSIIKAKKTKEVKR